MYFGNLLMSYKLVMDLTNKNIIFYEPISLVSIVRND